MLKWFSRVFVALFVIVTITFFSLRSLDVPVQKLEKEYFNLPSAYMDIKNIKVHYRIEGSGPPLLLLHGTGASLHTWDKWTDLLQSTYTIYRLDLPGFGLTGATYDRNYSMDNYIAFIHSFTEQLGLKSFAIAGNSLGGNIAWNYTLTYPDRVRQLVLIDAAGYPLGRPTQSLAFQVAQNPFLSPLLLHITPKSFIRKNLLQVYGDDSKVSDELVDRYHDLTLRRGNRRAFVDRANTNFADRSQDIPKISCPTLVLWGELDTWIPLSHAYKFKNDIPNATLITYPGAGHIPMEEIPTRTARDLDTWLKSQIVN